MLTSSLRTRVSRRARKLAAICLASALLVGAGATQADQTAEAASSSAPSPDATSYVVGNLDSGAIIASRNRNKELRPASTLKLLTALALVDQYPKKSKRLKTSKATAAVEPTEVGLKTGYSYTADQLFHALLIMSANDAAYALTEGTGSMSKGMKIINAKAKQIGMKSTVAKSPAGLDGKGQHVTARDMMVLAKHVLDNKYLAKILKKTSYKFAGGKKLGKAGKTVKTQSGQTLYTHTKIAGFIKGGLGLKNGYTTKAGQTFVGAAKRNGKRYVTVILHGDEQPRPAAIDLLDWAFAEGKPKALARINFKKIEQKPKPKPSPAKPSPGASEGPQMSGGANDGISSGGVVDGQ